MSRNPTMRQALDRLDDANGYIANALDELSKLREEVHRLDRARATATSDECARWTEAVLKRAEAWEGFGTDGGTVIASDYRIWGASMQQGDGPMPISLHREGECVDSDRKGTT